LLPRAPGNLVAVPRAIALLLTLVLPITACGDGSTTEITTGAYRAFRDQPVACGADRPQPAREMQFDAPADLGLTANVRVTLHTSCGPVVLEVFPDLAPLTVNSFVFLAERGYFDGTVMHRVLPGFVIQAGDPTATGSGGPGYLIPDELPPAGFEYGPGIVAMANRGPNTSGSQFFLVLGDTGLPAAYSVFGAVIDGFDAVAGIASVPLGQGPTGEPSRPLETIYIESVTVER
jgi:cyclophilin family peptidyl-prolyl cis-trans isomerase